MPHRIAVLALDGVVPFDLGTATQVFGAARDSKSAAHDTSKSTPLDTGKSAAHDTGKSTAPDNAKNRLYEVQVCGTGPVRTTAGFTIIPDHDLSALDSADTVVVPGVDAGSTVTDGTLRDDVRKALQEAAARNKRIVSICTGASVLAAAGLLDGRPAATHWLWGKRIGGLYPRVRWNLDVLFVDDGDILTSAGVGAGADLCLHIVRNDHGAEVANRTARRCVLPPWRDGGQAQFIERPMPHSDGAGTAPTRAWTLDRLAEPVTLEAMAEHARMSVRTFTRRFREETGDSPRQWLLRQRIAHAQVLLESTDLGVETVARRSGLGSATALRQHLQTAIGVAPSAYRRTFRQPATS